MVGARFDASDAETSQYAQIATERETAVRHRQKQAHNNIASLLIMVMLIVGLDMHWLWLVSAGIVWAMDRVGFYEIS